MPPPRVKSRGSIVPPFWNREKTVVRLNTVKPIRFSTNDEKQFTTRIVNLANFRTATLDDAEILLEDPLRNENVGDVGVDGRIPQKEFPPSAPSALDIQNKVTSCVHDWTSTVPLHSRYELHPSDQTPREPAPESNTNLTEQES